MAQAVSRIEILQQFETPVRTLNGVNRFITMVGWIHDIPVAGGSAYAETYTCLIGPVMREHEFLGATYLPSIANLDVSTVDLAQCSIDSCDAEWDEDSGRIELRVHVSGTGAAATLTLLFSVTILVGGY